MTVPEPRVDDEGTLFCYALADSVWVACGAVSNGGIVVRWAGRALVPDLLAGGPRADVAVLALAAGAPAGCDGLVMLPYLMAERVPPWDPDLPGAYLGLRRDHGRGPLVRAAIEGVCLQLRIIMDQLDRLHPVRSVRVTGGALRAPLWRDVLAAALDRPLHTVGDAEGTASAPPRWGCSRSDARRGSRTPWPRLPARTPRRRRRPWSPIRRSWRSTSACAPPFPSSSTRWARSRRSSHVEN